MKKPLLLLAFSVFLFTGCGTSIKNVSAFTKQDLKPTKFMPPKEILTGERLPRVIILDLDDKTSKVAKQANLGTSLAGEIDQQLTQGKSVEILKRVQKTTIDEEMKLAELSDAVGGEELGSANYIIGGKVNNAIFRHEYKEKSIGRDFNGNLKINPAKFFYFAEVRGVVKVYELPSLEVVATFDFEDNKAREDEASTSVLGLGKTDTSTMVKRDDAMVREAGADAMNTLRIPLKNFFAKKGYIYEKRAQGSKTIVQVTLGSKNGAKEGEKVKFFTIEENYNPLTQITKRETIAIGEGVISNQIRPESSWIIVEEVFQGKDLRAGDFIQIEYESSFGDTMNSAGKAINSSGIMKYKDTIFNILIDQARK